MMIDFKQQLFEKYAIINSRKIQGLKF